MNVFTKMGLLMWFAATGPALMAETTNSGQTQSGLSGSAISKEQAKSIALKLVPGKIIEVEFEKHKGEPVYSIEIRANDGVYEVVLKEKDGTLLEKKGPGKHEDDDDEDEDNQSESN